jgi:L-2-hydroxyglutarate oxidase LhgO
VGCIVVGAGVVGLAVGRALALSGREVLILDGEGQFGSWTSSRNSEVIHAGIYYPPGSLKARLCVDGRERLYRYCFDRHIPHVKTGKLIVASSPAQVGELESIEANARANDVSSLRWVDQRALATLEPELLGHGALLSPETGVIDSHAYMLSLLADAEAAGAQVIFRTTVDRLDYVGQAWRVHCRGLDEPLAAEVVVNCAGLAARDLARTIDALCPTTIPRLFLAKGSYFVYSGRTPFRHLVYPVPEPGGLGVHLTLDLGGQARFGPDVEWISQVDYTVDPGRKRHFEAAIRSYWPGLDTERLTPGYAGIRPKLSGPGEPAVDFRISGPGDHGLPGLVNLYGIESPGLTAALAIGDYVGALVKS